MSGARHRWLVFALGGAAFCLSFFHRVAPVSIAGELTRSFAVSGAALGALAATYFYVYTLMQIPTGVLVDTLGPKRVLTAGGVAAGVGSILFGLADTFWGAALGRTLAGLGVSVAFVALLKICAQWFDERHFATMASCVNFIGLLGALMATVPLAWLVTQVSWRAVFVAVGVASLLVAVLTAWLTKDHASTAAHNSGGRNWRADLAAVLKNRATWPAFWVNFGLSGSYMSFVGLWLAPLLTQVYGKSAVAASQHAAAIIAALAISSVGVAHMSDRWRKRKPVLLLAASLYLSVWAVWLVGVQGEWTLFLCVLTGMVAPGFMFAWSVAKEVNPPEHAGMAISVANTGGFLAAGILQPLAGAMLDASKVAGSAATQTDFRFAMAPVALFAVIGFAGAVFVRETHCRNIWAENIKSKKGLAGKTG